MMLIYQLILCFLISQIANQNQLLQQQKWQSLFTYITFEQTLSAFPFLRQNINPFKIADAFKPYMCGVGLLPVLILNNRIYFQGPYRNHKRAIILKNIMNSILAKTVLPDMYFILHFQDFLHINYTAKQEHKICRELPMFMFNKNGSAYLEQTKFLFPDSYITQKWDQGIQGIKQCNLKNPQEKKDPRAFFRGMGSSPSYLQLIPINKDTNFNRYYHRGALVELSKQKPDLIYARLIYDQFSRQHFNQFLNELKRRVGASNVIEEKVPQNTYCQYRYLIVPDGYGTPWRRLPIALFSNSLMIKPRSEKFQWFYDKMTPGIHFVQVKRDLSDLVQTIEKLNKDKDLRIKMIKNANQFAEKYLTSQAITSFIIQQLKKYANVQKMAQILNQEEKKSLEMQLNRGNVEIRDVLKKMYRTNKQDIDKRIFNVNKFIENKQNLIEKSKNISTQQALPQIKKPSPPSEINNKSSSQALPQIKKQSSPSEINNKSSSQALPQINKNMPSSQINNRSSSSIESLPLKVNPIEYIALVVVFTFVFLLINCCQKKKKKQVPVQINQQQQQTSITIVEVQQTDSCEREIMQKP